MLRIGWSVASYIHLNLADYAILQVARNAPDIEA